MMSRYYLNKDRQDEQDKKILIILLILVQCCSLNRRNVAERDPSWMKTKVFLKKYGVEYNEEYMWDLFWKQKDGAGFQ